MSLLFFHLELQDILNHYRESANNRFLAKAIVEPSTSRIHLQGLVGSSDAMISCALYQTEPHPALFILGDREEAAYFQNNIENILGEHKVLFFPSSYKKSFQLETTDNNLVLERAEVLTRISKSQTHFMVVTYPDAIHERVVTKHTLERNTMEARVGEKISVDFIMEFLHENHFERSDFVYDPGQYAVRGGIVDVYSFAHEMPYRIEFNNDIIESIRAFDPSSQLSEKDMHFVTIIPNVQTGMMKEDHESFFDFIPKNTVIWAKDLAYTFDFIRLSLQKVEEKYGNEIISETDGSKQQISDLFDDVETLILKLEQHTVFEFGSKTYFDAAEKMVYHQQPPPHFNKNFNLLLDHFYKNQKNKYINFIFSDSAKQIERIYSIFEDIAKPAEHSGVELKFNPLLISLHEGFIDNDLKFACYTDHQIFDRYHRFRLRKNYSRSEAITLKDLYSLKPGDFITHIDHGIGRFAGLETIDANGTMQEAIRLVYKDSDILYISIHSLHRIARYTGKEGTQPTLNKLGSATWATLKQKTKKRVKDIAKDLIQLYAKRRVQKGFAFNKDTYLQTELEASFIYEDTPDQIKSTRDVKRDMEKEYPMDRLVCGDVGFGKTEIAIRAAFKAVTDGKQVAILVPTTILALQHYRTFKDRLKDFPCTVDYINRFKSSAQQTETLKKLAEGKIDILIGTHRIISKDVKFKDLGLMIIDEEQKFGVASKEKLKAMRINVDSLTLTATPIPRTLQFSLMGARDLSIINTPPPNRYPVTTEVHVFNDKLIKESIDYEVSRGGQVFFVHNRVQDIHDIAAMIKKLCPGVKIAVGHGQMDGNKLEEVLMSFIEGDTDILIATTIIESGLDISNANTMIINNAHYFGLSDLHQMRGRVGRSNKKAFCYLLAPPLTVLTPEARQRLKAIEEHAELGSGFNVAMRDLDIRGAGNMLGGEQSGFMADIGFDTYQKILDEAIRELKRTKFKDLFREEIAAQDDFVQDCTIDTDLEILIPDSYVENITERLSLYSRLDNLESEEGLKDMEKEFVDRFGALVPQVKDLFTTVRCRKLAVELGFERLILKHDVLKCYFINKPESPYFESPVFKKILDYLQTGTNKAKLKQVGKLFMLVVEPTKTMHEVLLFLQRMHVAVKKPQAAEV